MNSGLGDVVTKTPNFILFNLALTMIGLSVVGLCMAIVQVRTYLRSLIEWLIHSTLQILNPTTKRETFYPEIRNTLRLVELWL